MTRLEQYDAYRWVARRVEKVVCRLIGHAPKIYEYGKTEGRSVAWAEVCRRCGHFFRSGSSEWHEDNPWKTGKVCCTWCGHAHIAVWQLGTEFPLQCSYCEGMTCNEE